MADSIRQQLAEKITAAWRDGYAAEVITSNGLSVDALLKSRLLPSENEVISLSFNEFRLPEERPENGAIDGKPDGYEWTLSIRCRTDGITDDDHLFALVLAAVEYLCQHPRLTGDYRRFSLYLTTGGVVPSMDMSYETFEIPITLR